MPASEPSGSINRSLQSLKREGHNSMFRHNSPHSGLNRFVAMLAFTAACLSILVLVNVRADADTTGGPAPTQQVKQLPREPYGGCDEAWQAPLSEGARWCERHGWTVTSQIVVGPRGVVQSTGLPRCTEEDASSGPVPCSWNFGRPVNGPVLSYWVDRYDRTHYVWATNPAHRHGWRWVSRSLSDVLAEGGYLNADSRDWGQCVRRGNVVRCANGDRLRLS